MEQYFDCTAAVNNFNYGGTKINHPSSSETSKFWRPKSIFASQIAAPTSFDIKISGAIFPVSYSLQIYLANFFFSARTITCLQNFLRRNITVDRNKIRLLSPHTVATLGDLPPANSTPSGAHLSRIRRIDCVLFIDYDGYIDHFRPDAVRL
jgi:hypothetical protein